MSFNRIHMIDHPHPPPRITLTGVLEMCRLQTKLDHVDMVDSVEQHKVDQYVTFHGGAQCKINHLEMNCSLLQYYT